jgi:hypothetical protein
MQKNSTTGTNEASRPIPEPVVLTQEETTKIAAGLAATVISVTGRPCLTCGIGALGPYQAT